MCIRDRAKTAPPNKKLSSVVPFWESLPVAITPRRFLRHRSLLLRSPRLDSRARTLVVSLPEAAASRSVATSPQTVHASDALPPTSAGSTAHASPAAHPSLPASAACWSVTSSRYHPAESAAATGCPGCRREC